MDPSLSRPTRSLISRLRLPDSLLFGIAAASVGLFSAAAVWLFKRTIDLVHAGASGFLGAWLAQLAPWSIVLVPVVGGLAVGLLARWLIAEERHHGVAGVIEAVALAGGRLRYRRIAQKAFVSAVSIGSGASVGPEAPSVQLGANLGSLLGVKLQLSEDRVRALVAAGAGAGIAAAFNAPIAGIFFALEIVLVDLASDALFGIILASVASAVFTQAVSGPQPAFHVPAYTFHSGWELPLYFGLGLLAGPVSAAYIRLIYWIQDAFTWSRIPKWLAPAVAGLGLGLVGLALPQALGIGYDTIGIVLDSQALPIGLLLALLLAKLVLTPWSLGGGFRGGVFAPALFIGAMLGAAYAGVVALALPSLGVVAPPFALVGMAAVVAASVRAPMTAIVLLFEMTNDYRIILPLMFAVVVAMFLSERLEKHSVYSLGLARKGVRLLRGRDVEVLEGIRVEEVAQPTIPLREDETLAVAADTLVTSHHHGLPVVDSRGRLIGTLTLSDIDRARDQGLPADTPIGRIASRDLVTAFPEEPVSEALRRMSAKDVGRLPVVSPQDPSRLVGVLRRADVIHAYQLALSRRAIDLQRGLESRLAAFSGAPVREVVVAPSSACDGKTVGEVRWPKDCVVASLRRGSSLLVPHGGTRLQAGDILVVVAEDDKVWEELEAVCGGPD